MILKCMDHKISLIFFHRVCGATPQLHQGCIPALEPVKNKRIDDGDNCSGTQTWRPRLGGWHEVEKCVRPPGFVVGVCCCYGRTVYGGSQKAK